MFLKNYRCGQAVRKLTWHGPVDGQLCTLLNMRKYIEEKYKQRLLIVKQFLGTRKNQAYTQESYTHLPIKNSIYPLADKLKMANVVIEPVGSNFEGLSFPEVRSLARGKDLIFDELDINLRLTSLIAREPQRDSTDEKMKGISLCLDADKLVDLHYSKRYPGYAYLTVPSKSPLVQRLYGALEIRSDIRAQYYISPTTVLNEFQMQCEYKAYKPVENNEKRGLMDLESALVVREPPALQMLLKTMHGMLTLDLTIAVPCIAWPSFAMKCLYRRRKSGWPSPNLLKKMLDVGCRVVPRPPNGSVEGRRKCLLWRLSFSAAERILMQDLTEAQKRAYLLAKFIFKLFLKRPGHEGIKSYHLKTVFFWTLELVPRHLWTFDASVARAIDILRVLNRCLTKRQLPHYFIPGNNLFHTISDEVLFILQQRVQSTILNVPDILCGNEDSLRLALTEYQSRGKLMNLECVTMVIETRKSFMERISAHPDFPQVDLRTCKTVLAHELERLTKRFCENVKTTATIRKDKEIDSLVNLGFATDLSRYKQLYVPPTETLSSSRSSIHYVATVSSASRCIERLMIYLLEHEEHNLESTSLTLSNFIQNPEEHGGEVPDNPNDIRDAVMHMLEKIDIFYQLMGEK